MLPTICPFFTLATNQNPFRTRPKLSKPNANISKLGLPSLTKIKFKVKFKSNKLPQSNSFTFLD